MVSAHAETGHFSLRKTPRPARALPHELPPFHNKIFFSGVVEDSCKSKGGEVHVNWTANLRSGWLFSDVL